MFYHFNQNNSGGHFEIDDNIAHHVIIEAENHDHANALAEQIGVYFNGCETDMDCPCCGDRWHPTWEMDGDTHPLLYGKNPEDHNSSELFTPVGKPYCHVYFLDGTKKSYIKQSKNLINEEELF